MATTAQRSSSSDGSPADTIPVRNPATGESLGRVPNASAEGVAAMAERARNAQSGWAQVGFEGRGEVLRRFSQWILDNMGRLGDVVMSETGKPRDEVVLAEIGYPVAACQFWADKAPEWLADEIVESVSPYMAGKKLLVRYAPVGVVGVIGPWNFPLANAFGDCIPALAAGNAVICKPSEVTPLTPLVLAEGLAECGLPDGVFNVLTGDGEAGAVLIDEVDFVMFTGSTETGRRVMERAARTLTPVSLEMGGKDPMIVLADADLERAANGAVFYGMTNAGQVCISVERVYVEAPAYEEFVEKVTSKVEALRQGAPEEPGSVDVGAMIDPAQPAVVSEHVADAVSKGARVLTGGGVGDEAGRFFEPTVLVDVDHSMRAMTEETFGPTLPIMRVRDADEAVELANDSSYGLSASVWTRDTKKGEQVARRLEAGSVCVNDAQLSFMAIELPFGGWKASGVGGRHGLSGIRKYTLEQAIVVTPGDAPERDAHMFPYTAEETSAIEGMVRDLYGRGS